MLPFRLYLASIKSLSWQRDIKKKKQIRRLKTMYKKKYMYNFFSLNFLYNENNF